ncbi:TrkH family potassium uptake protein [Agromyces sp. Soil535]|uniref:TrkH family potassium uptake protein n=1 Tax=Agromyces sp. Soil535 TaxID=1736390 RepID=UPI001F265EC2|nr:potassium transporter TrkG [Agromyces sp. Soil535]
MSTREPVQESPAEGLRRRFRLHPAQVVVVGFVGAIAIGTILLLLPGMTAPGRSTTFVDALFTATSAVTTTGLASVDTATHWTFLGQLAIIVMTQVGGLGILISAALVGVLLARRLSLRTRLNAASEFQAEGFTDLRKLVRAVVGLTLLIEAIVALLLFLRFLIHYGWDVGRAAWNAVFDSISAFANLGFALQTDNMMGFVSDPFVCLPLCAGVILGGLGFPVIVQLWRDWAHPLRWSMNTNLMVTGTIGLLVLGSAYLTFVEWDNPDTFGRLDPPARVLAGFFASTMTRTGGFNSVDLAAMRDESWFASDVLMFIGAGPASVGGGIRVTTFLVLFFIMLAELRGEGNVNIFGKRLSRAVHRQAITIVLISVAVVVAPTLLLLQLTEFPLGRVLFEVISAFSTTGLSTGITPDLPDSAKIVLAVVMLVGRVGPLTLGGALVLRERRILYEFPRERPVVG